MRRTPRPSRAPRRSARPRGRSRSRDGPAGTGPHRQQVGQGRLVEQRVPAGDQDDVEVGLAGKPGEHVRLVHRHPDGSDRALGPEPLEGRKGARQRLMVVMVGIVDEDDVDPLESEPPEAALHRPHDAVEAEVVSGAARPPASDLATHRKPPESPPDLADESTNRPGIAGCCCAQGTPGLRGQRWRRVEEADLRRHDQLATRQVAERPTEPSFGHAVAVARSSVEHADPALIRPPDDRQGLRLVHRPEHTPDRRRTHAERREAQPRRAGQTRDRAGRRLRELHFTDQNQRPRRMKYALVRRIMDDGATIATRARSSCRADRNTPGEISSARRMSRSAPRRP